jgi:hypothetical protein
MRPDTPSPPPYLPTQQQPRRRPQSRAVIMLAVTLAVLLTIWIVGSILLVQYAPNLGDLPGRNPSTEAPSTR